jgi:hypothetical protein
MTKKLRLAVLLALSLTLTLLLVGPSLAAPNLIGNWAGSAAKITVSAGCGSDTVVLTISNQCTNLFSGTILVGTESVPVVGKFSPADNTLYLSGEMEDIQNIIFDTVIVTGTYVAGNPSNIAVTSFTYYHITSDNPTAEYNTEYDNFTLIKQ